METSSAKPAAEMRRGRPAPGGRPVGRTPLALASPTGALKKRRPRDDGAASAPARRDRADKDAAFEPVRRVRAVRADSTEPWRPRDGEVGRGSGGRREETARKRVAAQFTSTAPRTGGAGRRRDASPVRRPSSPLRAKPVEIVAGEPVRIQKLLSTHGRGSRREVDDLIAEGRVTVNGVIAQLGDRATAVDRIEVDGTPIRLGTGTVERAVLLYHKPAGEIVSQDDPEGRPSVFANLPRPASGRWIPIGRLDYNTSGLLLLTTWGDLAARLMHPSHEVEREYAVRMLGELDAEQRLRLVQGVDLEDGPARFDQLEEAGGDGINRWYSVTLREGRNREVRRMVEAVGLVVSRLIRVRFGPITLPRDLARGRSREATPAELLALATAVGLNEGSPDAQVHSASRAPRTPVEIPDGPPAAPPRSRGSDAGDGRRGAPAPRRGRGADDDRDGPRASAPRSGPVGKRGGRVPAASARPDRARASPPDFEVPSPRDARTGGPRSGAPRSAGGRSDGLRTEGPRSVGSRSGAPRSGAPRSAAPRSGAPRTGGARSAAPRAGSGKSGGGRRGG